MEEWSIWPKRVLGERARREDRRWTWRTLALELVVVVLLVYLVLGVVWGITVVDGFSMEPVLGAGDMALFYRLSLTVDRGDIVVLNTEAGRLIKRVVAVGGDVVELDEQTGRLRVNGAQEDGYITQTQLRDGLALPGEVPANHILVLGDNRGVSYDSRDMGYIQEADIVGKVILMVRKV